MSTLFVKTDAHPLLLKLTRAYVQLETVVREAEDASRQCRQAQSELFTPIEGNPGKSEKSRNSKKVKTARQLADERKLQFVSASLREQCAFNPLADAMDDMYAALATIKDEKRQAQEDDEFLGFMADTVSINIIASVKLYNRAIKALSKLGLNGYEWTLGCCADQQAERALASLEKTPALPAREHENPYWTHVSAHVMARILQFIDQFGEGGGGGCIALDRERHEERAAYLVARLLREKGWQVDIQDRPALCVQVPAKTKEDF
ncbi:MAG: hypothetical protein K8F91_12395 [Candidatus Obscuribacterales bacterium]|nr:hypothetical protein [Candidatus Obscuribacterales bacterium]